MERTLSPARADATTLHVDVTPVMLVLPRGSAVFTVQGEAWLTQEGRPDDFILQAGTRFDVATAHPIVVSATRERATLHIVRPVGACQRMARDVYDFARCRAQRLRREELARLGGRLTASLHTWARRLRGAFAARVRLTTQ